MTETQNLHQILRATILVSLEETFENVRGIYLDRGTSLFETLATISAEEASIPGSDRCGTIAAHVAHTTYYMDILLEFSRGNKPETDWGHIWNTIGAVTDEDWQGIQQELRESYQKVREFAENTDLSNEKAIQGIFGILMHTAYHVGEIRQMLCKIKSLDA